MISFHHLTPDPLIPSLHWPPRKDNSAEDRKKAGQISGSEWWTDRGNLSEPANTLVATDERTVILVLTGWFDCLFIWKDFAYEIRCESVVVYIVVVFVCSMREGSCGSDDSILSPKDRPWFSSGTSETLPGLAVCLIRFDCLLVFLCYEYCRLSLMFLFLFF